MLQSWRMLPGAGLLLLLALISSCTLERAPGPLSGQQLRDRCASLSGDRIDAAAHITDTRILGPIRDVRALAPWEASPEYCKVTAAFDESALRFSVWMPTADWNGKLAFIGGGGFDGVLMDEQFFLVFSASVLTGGYAIVATNGGYDAPQTQDPLAYFEASFAADPEKRADFMYRSEHRTLPVAEALINRYYGTPPSHRYFEGCSMGGHDALLLSQRYPDDFDGIVARAPAGNVVGLMRQFHRIGSYLQRTGVEFEEAHKALLANAVLEHCDALDGLADGIISRPHMCRFDPRILKCTDAPAQDCLTSEQIELIELVTSPFYGEDGEMVHPGFHFGGEDQEQGWGEYVWPRIMTYSMHVLFSQGFVRSFVTGDPDYDTRHWDASEWQDELATLEQEFNAFDPDLHAFAQRRGKLILWTGTLDTAVSPKDTVRYYEKVVRKLGSVQAGNTVELFLAPGVAHCFGGSGPDRIDLMQALAIWVEQDIPPSAQQLVHDKLDDSGSVLMSRPLCLYPAYPHYDGAGDPAAAESFACTHEE